MFKLLKSILCSIHFVLLRKIDYSIHDNIQKLFRNLFLSTKSINLLTIKDRKELFERLNKYLKNKITNFKNDYVDYVEYHLNKIEKLNNEINNKKLDLNDEYKNCLEIELIKFNNNINNKNNIYNIEDIIINLLFDGQTINNIEYLIELIDLNEYLYLKNIIDNSLNKLFELLAIMMKLMFI